MAGPHSWMDRSAKTIGEGYVNARRIPPGPQSVLCLA
jgi:hypothetical protein